MKVFKAKVKTQKAKLIALMASSIIFTFSFLLFALPIRAQSGGTYEMKKSVIANGGAQSDSPTITMTGTAGQTSAGVYSGNNRYAMRSGFWTPSVPRSLNGKICYTNGGDIWKMDPDGSNRQLVIDAGTNDIEPAWSPDGSKIAFKSDRSPSPNGGIWVVNADGTGLVLLTNTPSSGNAKPTWSPDGSKIAFDSSRDGLIGSIYVMDPDGSNVTRLTNQLPFSDAGAEWSPDGTRMIFETNQGFGSNIGIINLDGTGRAVIGPGRFPAWSPDGSKIIFALLTPGGYHIYTMNPDGSGLLQLTFGAPNDQYPSFSPDGRKIVFARNTSGTIGLWTMNADGSGQVIFPGTNTIGNGYSDWQRSLNTPVGAPITFQIDEATVTFANVPIAGTTSFTPITPIAAQLPPGYVVCPTCPSYDISTTAIFTAPVTVCLHAPAITSPVTFNLLRILHDEGGVLIDRTVSRDFATRKICAMTSSLSPFVVAFSLAPTAANISVGGRVSNANGRGIAKVRVTIADQDGVVGSAITNPFGYFRFENIPAGRTYIVSVRSKQYQFAIDSQVVQANDDVTGLEFVALPE